MPRKLNVFKKHEPRVLEEHGISLIFTLLHDGEAGDLKLVSDAP